MDKLATSKQIKDHATTKNKAVKKQKPAKAKAGGYSIDDEGNLTKDGDLICQVIFKDYDTVKDLRRLCDTLNECGSK